MHYLDASALVAVVTAEIHRPVIQRWMRDRENDLAVSSWTLAEASSALSLKVRTRQIDLDEKATALRQIENMRQAFLTPIPIDETHFFAARQFADRHDSGLRAGDALHVAIAADFGLTLVTLDKGMATGARYLGLAVVLLPEQ